MKELTIYHNPRCSKSRQTLQILRDRGIEPNIVEYLKTPLQKDELKKISTSLGLRPKEFARKNESDFKEKSLSYTNETTSLPYFIYSSSYWIYA